MADSTAYGLGRHHRFAQVGGDFFRNRTVCSRFTIWYFAQVFPDGKAERSAGWGERKFTGRWFFPCKVAVEPVFCGSEDREVVTRDGLFGIGMLIVFLLAEPEAANACAVADERELSERGVVFCFVKHDVFLSNVCMAADQQELSGWRAVFLFFAVRCFPDACGELLFR